MRSIAFTLKQFLSFCRRSPYFTAACDYGVIWSHATPRGDDFLNSLTERVLNTGGHRALAGGLGAIHLPALFFL